MIHHEGLLELDAIYHFETSPCIARYREQVATIHYADGARLRRYTPDFELHLTSGDLVLVEIKPEAMLSDPDTLHKFNRVAEHFERAAQAFEIVTDIVIRAEPRMTNLRTIYQRASRVPMTDEAMSAIANRYRHLFPMTIGQSTEMMRRGGITPYCLLLADLVRCALTQPLVDATPLYVSEEPNHATLLSQKRLGF